MASAAPARLRRPSGRGWLDGICSAAGSGREREAQVSKCAGEAHGGIRRELPDPEGGAKSHVSATAIALPRSDERRPAAFYVGEQRSAHADGFAEVVLAAFLAGDGKH
mmetsp:Transcript_125929/g.362137  ORF Transcript_125929/g.362137 Transcript_125929/m.362137 type:complete len:108 (+) Transcript_125929:30-353(+)